MDQPILIKTFNLPADLAASGFIQDYASCLRKTGYTRDRVNLPARDISNTFISQIRGDISTRLVQQQLQSSVASGVVVRSYDDLRNDFFESSDPGWELIHGKNEDVPDLLNLPSEQITISVKSSIIPWPDTMPSRIPAMQNLDFKILREHQDYRLDLHADVEVQVYFPYDCNKKINEFLVGKSPWRKDNNTKINELINYAKKHMDATKANNKKASTQDVIKLFLESLANKNLLLEHIEEILSIIQKSYIVGFTTAHAIADRIKNPPDKKPVIFMKVGAETKEFWKAPFKELCVGIEDINKTLKDFPSKEERGCDSRPARPRNFFFEANRLEVKPV